MDIKRGEYPIPGNPKTIFLNGTVWFVINNFRGLPSPSLTWHLKMMVSKRNLLFQGAIFRFHVKLWEGILLMVDLTARMYDDPP